MRGWQTGRDSNSKVPAGRPYWANLVSSNEVVVGSKYGAREGLQAEGETAWKAEIMRVRLALVDENGSILDESVS